MTRGFRNVILVGDAREVLPAVPSYADMARRRIEPHERQERFQLWL